MSGAPTALVAYCWFQRSHLSSYEDRPHPFVSLIAVDETFKERRPKTFLGAAKNISVLRQLSQPSPDVSVMLTDRKVNC
ncbi:hypothetical protein PQQ84_34030 [Paraburkholderia strydomiana]|uniref:hypothetical protein n=1 Tax=Paraburkholderia strydomiana TaxID=1245417 RepID=UPI0038BE0D83